MKHLNDLAVPKCVSWRTRWRDQKKGLCVETRCWCHGDFRRMVSLLAISEIGWAKHDGVLRGLMPRSEHRFPASSSRLCQNWLRYWRGTSSHSEHRFPAPSSRLCQNWLRYWRPRHSSSLRTLSTDAVSALRKVGVLMRLWKQHGVEART